MKRKTVAAGMLVALALASSAAAQVTAVIKGPDKSQPGDLVILDAGASNAAKLHWILVNSDKTFLPVDGGKRLVFASGTEKEYRFVLVAAGAGEDGELDVEIAEHVLTIGKPAPGPQPGPAPGPQPGPAPGPGPQPGPAPGPDLPDGEFQLAKWGYETVTAKVVGTAKAKAGMIADCFESNANLIDPPDPNLTGHSTIGELVSATLACNRAVAGDDRAAWVPFFEALDTKLTELAEGGKLTTLAQHKTAWNEIAAGIRAAEKQLPSFR